MTLTELCTRLEELEQEGYGERSVEVIPAPPPVEDWSKASDDNKERFRINFVIMNYVVIDVSAPSPICSDGPLNLIFTEGCEMPIDSELANEFATW